MTNVSDFDRGGTGLVRLREKAAAAGLGPRQVVQELFQKILVPAHDVEFSVLLCVIDSAALYHGLFPSSPLYVGHGLAQEAAAKLLTHTRTVSAHGLDVLLKLARGHLQAGSAA